MAQQTTGKYIVPVVRPAFSLFKSDTEQKGTPAMATGAAKKSQRQSKLSVVRSDEQTQEIPVNTAAEAQAEREAAQAATAKHLETAEREQATIDELKAQRRAIDEQLKVAKANQPAKQPKPEKPAKTLDDVAAHQAETVGIGHVLYIASRAMARVKMGQGVDSAVNDVAAREGEAAVGAIKYFQTGDYPTMRAALMAWCSEHAPLTVVRQHTQVSDESDEQ